MRLDKFLKVSRLIKRRSVAATACDSGRICVNGSAAKPGRQLKTGDVIELAFGEKTVKVKVAALSETAKKEAAGEMYEVIL